MTNHRRNAGQAKWASNELSRLAKVKRRRNAVPATKEAQRELAATAAADHPITRVDATPEQIEKVKAMVAAKPPW